METFGASPVFLGKYQNNTPTLRLFPHSLARIDYGESQLSQSFGDDTCESSALCIPRLWLFGCLQQGCDGVFGFEIIEIKVPVSSIALPLECLIPRNYQDVPTAAFREVPIQI